MLFLRLSSILLAAVSCHARSVPRGIPGGNVFDQVRFLNCKDGLITAYYDAPPSYTGPPTYATRWGKPVDGWNKGSTSSGTDSNGKKWEWDLRKYTKYVDPSKKYIGNVTYQGEGFNCFGDDGHQVHVDRKYGQCYTTAFCIHHEATIINFSASTDAVSWATHTTSPVAPPDFPDPQGAVNGIMAKVRKAKTGPMTCDSSSISIGNGCSMLVTCESSDVTGEALTGLIDTMVNTYASDSTLFKPINTGSCHGPAMTSCDYYRGVSIPARYHLATANVAPPEGDGSLPRPASSGLKATLSVVISCKANERNPFLCSMLRAATVVGGATIGGFPGGMFGGYGMLVIGSCG